MPAKGTKLSPEARAKVAAAHRKPQVMCTCKNCGRVFYTRQCEVVRGGGVYCNRRCEGEYKTGRKMSPESNMKKSLAFRGRTITPEWRANISASMKKSRR
jgi:hypothetical protein